MRSDKYSYAGVESYASSCIVLVDRRMSYGMYSSRLPSSIWPINDVLDLFVKIRLYPPGSIAPFSPVTSCLLSSDTPPKRVSSASNVFDLGAALRLAGGLASCAAGASATTSVAAAFLACWRSRLISALVLTGSWSGSTSGMNWTMFLAPSLPSLAYVSVILCCKSAGSFSNSTTGALDASASSLLSLFHASATTAGSTGVGSTGFSASCALRNCILALSNSAVTSSICSWEAFGSDNTWLYLAWTASKLFSAAFALCFHASLGAKGSSSVVAAGVSIRRTPVVIVPSGFVCSKRSKPAGNSGETGAAAAEIGGAVSVSAWFCSSLTITGVIVTSSVALSGVGVPGVGDQPINTPFS